MSYDCIHENGKVIHLFALLCVGMTSGKGSGKCPPNNGSNDNTQDHAAYNYHDFLLDIVKKTNKNKTGQRASSAADRRQRRTC